MNDALQNFNAAKQAIERCRAVDEVKAIRDKAEALRQYHRQIGSSLEMQNDIAEIKVRAERRAGELLAETITKGGSSKSHDVTLNDCGLTRMQSHRWQTLARIPEDSFEAAIHTAKERQAELTSAALYKLGKKLQAQEPAEDQPEHEDVTGNLQDFVDAGLKFGTIYADPAWSYSNQGTRAATDNHYQTMSVAEICELPVKDLAADDSHLHLWTTNAFLFDAKQVIEAWGFEYKSCRIWCKEELGIGNYWRVSHEFLLLGVRGHPEFRARDKQSWVLTKRGRHSAKPEIFRKDIEEVSPGPYLEMFARIAAPGWSAWGNQVEKVLTSKG